MKIQHLDKIALVHINFDIWSGQTALKKDDLQIDPHEMNMDKVIQLGSKKVCDPEKLKGFSTLKTEARRCLLKYAIQFMNGFAVPFNRLDEILDKLDDIESRFNALKISFLNDYDENVNNWILENPSCAEQIRTGLIPKETVAKRINFDYQVFKIGPLDNERSSHRLQNKFSSAGKELVSEVISSASSFYSSNLAGKKQCDLKTKKTLENLRHKVDGLVFLNGDLADIVDLLDQTIAVYDSCNGRSLNGSAFDKLLATILILCDEERLEEYCRGSMNNTSLSNTSEISSEDNRGSMSDTSLSNTGEISSEDKDAMLINKWFNINNDKSHLKDLKTESDINSGTDESEHKNDNFF